MKKITIVLLCLISAAAYAQEPSVGLSFGLSSTNALSPNSPLPEDLGSRLGNRWGIVGHFPLNETFHLNTGILLEEKGWIEEFDDRWLVELQGQLFIVGFQFNRRF